MKCYNNKIKVITFFPLVRFNQQTRELTILIINTKVRAKEVFNYMMMGTTKECGSMINDMDMENIFGSLVTLKAMSMKVTG